MAMSTGARQVTRRIFASRNTRGTPPATAPRKKYIMGMGNRSMRASKGLASSSIPTPAPRQNTPRKIRLARLCFRKELTADTSLS